KATDGGGGWVFGAGGVRGGGERVRATRGGGIKRPRGGLQRRIPVVRKLERWGKPRRLQRLPRFFGRRRAKKGAGRYSRLDDPGRVGRTAQPRPVGRKATMNRLLAYTLAAYLAAGWASGAGWADGLTPVPPGQ